MTEHNEQQELDLIRRYSRKDLTADEVYCFTLTLCDNEIDRDHECFSAKTLEQLAPLFEGKSGIFDHDPKSKHQSARIFRTWVEDDPNRTTAYGAPYRRLRARAYMVRTDENKALIAEIEGGIKKEVSVGCAVNRVTCSICGSDRRTAGCAHRPGETYNGKVCYDILADAADAYEWSFVAVPAQREAGVTKSFQKEAIPTGSIISTVKSAADQLTLSAAQVRELQAQLAALETAAAEGAAYRRQLVTDVEKFVAVALPKVDAHAFGLACKAMPTDQLKAMRTALEAQAAEALPPLVQLRPQSNKPNHDNTPFCI
ncbi:MAG: hypothetical protein IJL52_00835 [Clostridia bacterium]|nr:hypothetical protein [Clostridia bacterium]